MIILFVSVVIVCLIAATAVCGFVWYVLSTLFFLFFFLKKIVGKWLLTLHFCRVDVFMISWS